MTPGRWLKFLIAVVIAAVVCASAVLGYFGTLNRTATARWRAYHKTLVATGEPLTLAEIEARRATIPREQNGALIIEDLTVELTTIGSENLPSVPLFGYVGKVDLFLGVPRLVIEPSREFIEKHQSTIDALAPLRELHNGRYGYPYIPESDNPLELFLPSLMICRSAAKLLSVCALVHNLDDKPNEAAEAVTAQVGVVGTLRNEPSIVPVLVRMTTLELALISLELTLRLGEIDEQHRDRINRAIADQLGSLSPREALLTERASCIKFFDGLATGKIPLSYLDNEFSMNPIPSVSVVPSRFGRLTKADIRDAQRHCADYWTGLIDAAEDPLELLVETEKVTRKATKLSIPNVSNMGKVLADRYMLNLNRFAVIHTTCIARLRSAQVALAAEKHRIMHGKLPTSFDELVPEFLDAAPIDPFNNQLLKMVKTDQGITIYSIGDDDSDDGGQVTPSENSKRPKDYGFRLVESEYRRLVIIEAEPEPKPDSPP